MIRGAILSLGLALPVQAAETAASAPAALKWHPGHYALFWQSPSDELLDKTVFASPYLTGAQIAYSWDKL